MSTRLAAYAVVAMAMSTALAAGAVAAASAGGRLDPSFGNGGRAVVSGIRECLPPGEGGGCWAGIGMAIQRNGAIVVAGGTLDSDCGSRFAIVRLQESGRPDPTFGDGGRVLTAVGSSSVAHAVVVLPDNRIVVGGELVRTESPCVGGLHLGGVGSKGFALARYRPDGTLDPSFGRDGRVATYFFDQGAGLDVLLQRDGKVVVVGVRNDTLALARYSGDGRLDPSFGQQGVVLTRFEGFSFPGKAALDKAGRILVPVSRWCYPCASYVVRYRPDGCLDRTFGHKGRAAVALTSITAVATFRGQIVVAGNLSRRENLPLAVSRLSSAGKLDRAFGQNGIRLLPVTWGWQPVLAIQKTGAILVAAGARPPGVEGFEDFNFTLTRVSAGGAVDRSFGRHGTVTDDFGDSDHAQAVGLQRDGKLLVAGVTGPAADEIGLARHLP
jgi:uncharacterized delta-60 repeat protein